MGAYLGFALSLAAWSVFRVCSAADQTSGSAVAQVTAATQHFYAALNAADAVAADTFLLPGGDSFPRSGRKLDPEAPTARESLRHLEALFKGGLRFHVAIRDLQVKTYGDTAVATFYTEGSTTTGANRPASEGV